MLVSISFRMWKCVIALVMDLQCNGQRGVPTWYLGILPWPFNSNLSMKWRMVKSVSESSSWTNKSLVMYPNRLVQTREQSFNQCLLSLHWILGDSHPFRTMTDQNSSNHKLLSKTFIIDYIRRHPSLPFSISHTHENRLRIWWPPTLKHKWSTIRPFHLLKMTFDPLDGH